MGGEYRNPAPPRPVDLETEAIRDLLERIRRLRKRVALPLLIAAAIFAWVGGALHATGHWSVFGTVGGRYVVSGFTLGVAAALCSFPLVIPGVGVYLLLRASVRARWRNDYRHREVSGRWSDREEWLASTSRRFG